MKRILLTALALAATGAFSILAQLSPPSGVVPDSYIVKLRSGSAKQVAQSAGVQLGLTYSRALNGFSAQLSADKVAALRRDPRVESVTPNRWFHVTGFRSDDDPANPARGISSSGVQTVPAGVSRIGAAPGSLAYNGTGVGIAVLDTGLDFTHPDLALASQQFSAFGGSAQDDEGHGTHVGGIIAALNNTTDVVGVAPGAKLYAVKKLDSTGSGSEAGVIAGLEWVLQNANLVSPRIRIVNMSLGRDRAPGESLDSPLRTAIKALDWAGISVVVSAGNNCDLEVSQKIPAAYRETIAVASVSATDGYSDYYPFFYVPADTASFFTTDGALIDDARNPLFMSGVTISAPGEERVDVIEDTAYSIGILSLGLGGGTERMSGTSMAAPHVAGVLALLHQQSASTGTRQLRQYFIPYGIAALYHKMSFDALRLRLRIIFGADPGLYPVDLKPFFDWTVLLGPVGPWPALLGLDGCWSWDGDQEGVLSAAGAIAQGAL